MTKRIVLRARGIALAIVAGVLMPGCPSGSGVGLDQNGRPPGEDGGTGPVTPSADFAALQANIFSASCTVCHAGAAAPVGLRLDAANSYAALVGIASQQVPTLLLVAPGDPDNSYLVQKLEGTASVGGQMPLGGPFLGNDERALVRQWITDGAQPAAVAPPTVPPTVLSVVPANGSILSVPPLSVDVVFSKNMDASLFSDLTFSLTGSGGDQTFGDGNEITVVSASVALSTTDLTTASMDLTGAALADDDYEIRLIGNGATALADENGLLLDGNGDGTAGDDFTARFTLTTQPATEATWRSIQDTVFTLTCTTGCHIAGGVAAFLPLDETNSYGALVGVASTEQPGLFLVDPLNADASFLIQKLEGTAAVGERMPLGGLPLTPEVITSIRLWIAQGAVMNPGDPVPDVMPPAVVISAPASPLSGTVTLSAAAIDNMGVVTVRFLIDGVVLESQTVAPYAVTWDTTTVANGNYTLTAEATDAAGNTGVSNALVTQVANPDIVAPVVALVDPGSPLSGTVTLTVNASDEVGVTAVRVFVDDLLLGTDMTAPYEFEWDTSAQANGNYVLSAEADDAAGNLGLAQTVSVAVDNVAPPDTQSPTLSIDTVASPASGIVNVTLQANDNVGVTEVRLFVDGELLGATSTAPYTLAWDTTAAMLDADYVLFAEADDAAGNTGLAVPVVVTVANGGPQASLDWIQENIFTLDCTTGCHVTGGIAPYLQLNPANAFADLVNQPSTQGGPEFRVLPGDPDGSSLIQRLEGTLVPSMPLGAAALPQNDIDAVRQWIARGAPEGSADTVAPVVTISAPASPLSGTVTLSATAVDNVGVVEVRFLVDGVVLETQTVAPYAVSWDTTTVANGAYTLTAQADDAAGSTSTSSALVVQVVNPDIVAPTVALIDPGSPVSGTVNLTVNASDEIGVTTVRVFVDNVLLDTDTTEPYEFNWDTTALMLDGDYVLSAEADDAAGNTGVAMPITVVVANGGPQATLDWIQTNIFMPSCTTGCHASGGIAAYLRLDPANAFDDLVNEPSTQGGPQFRVLPGDPDNSSLIQRLDGTLVPTMPLGGSALAQTDIDAVRQWILSGANQNAVEGSVQTPALARRQPALTED